MFRSKAELSVALKKKKKDFFKAWWGEAWKLNSGDTIWTYSMKSSQQVDKHIWDVIYPKGWAFDALRASSKWEAPACSDSATVFAMF